MLPIYMLAQGAERRQRAIFTAAAHAQRAADYLNGLQPGVQQEAAE